MGELPQINWGGSTYSEGSLKRNSWRSQREDEEHAMTEAEGENAI